MRNRLQALQSALLLIVLMFVAPVCLAQEYEYADFKEDNVFYKICEDSTTVEVCSQNSFGVIYFDSYSGDIVIPSKVTHDGKTYDVIGISGGAFYMCDGLTSVSIANSVTYIEGYGIMNSWQGSYYVGTFGNCTNLRSIIFPDHLTEIGPWSCFGCSALTEIKFPQALEMIGNSSFSNCSSLKTLQFPESLSSIGESAFSSCVSLKDVVLPEGLLDIGSSAFFECTGLLSIVIPSTVNSIGESALYGCSSLERIIVDSNNPVYDSRNDCNALIKTSANEIIRGCKVTVIPNSVTSIGSESFERCTGLTSLTIPESITRIGSSAFYGCRELDTVVCWPLIPPSLSSSAFGGVSQNMCVYVPANVLEAYQNNSVWGKLNILPMPGGWLTGDANGDGEVSIADINTIIDAILNDEMEDRYDVNGDGELNIADINALIDIILTS